MIWRREARSLALAILSILAFAASPSAAEPPRTWTGFYFGGHMGTFAATTNFSDPAGPQLYGGDVTSPGFMVGLQAGYDWQFAPQWLAGLQIDASIASSQGSNTCFQSTNSIIGMDCKVMPRSFGTMTGRLGYLIEPNGRTLLYGKGGLAWMHADLAIQPNAGFPSGAQPDPPFQTSQTVWGWTIGAGLEHAFTPAWSVSAEYNYLHFNGPSLQTPETTEVLPGSTVDMVPSKTTGLTTGQHVFKVGLNYRWGGAAKPGSEESAGAAEPSAAWVPAWEFDLGTRYWYSSGTFRNSNGSPTSLVSRLAYTEMVAHSGEVFARLDSPYNVFVKGVAGGGFIASGTMNDEDWGAAVSKFVPLAYSNSLQTVSGSLSYFTADIGFNILRGPNYKVGPFVGYSRLQMIMSSFGCAQLVNPDSGICEPATPTDTNGISEIDTWQSLRVGASAEVGLWERFKIGVDIAYLPAVLYNGLDIHHQRQPVAY